MKSASPILNEPHASHCARIWDMDDPRDLADIVLQWRERGFRLAHNRVNGGHQFIWETDRNFRVIGFTMDDERAAFKDAGCRLFSRLRQFTLSK